MLPPGGSHGPGPPADRVGVLGAGLVSRACREGPGQVLRGRGLWLGRKQASSSPDCGEGPEGSLGAIWPLAPMIPAAEVGGILLSQNLGLLTCAQ